MPVIMAYSDESRAVARKPCDATAVLFGLKFADDIHYKFKSSQASKARLQSSKHTGTEQNLTQNGDSRSFKVTCFNWLRYFAAYVKCSPFLHAFLRSVLSTDWHPKLYPSNPDLRVWKRAGYLGFRVPGLHSLYVTFKEWQIVKS